MRPRKGLDVRDLGSPTFKRQDLGRAFEPDACFNVQNGARIHGKSPLDLTADPSLDLSMSFRAGGPNAVQHPLTRHH
ncbi:MAG: hypothetical protein ACRERE_29825 [Candidatus Entotheonellia bacterium]